MFAALNEWRKSPWTRRALAVVAGVTLALSFPKAGIAGLAWVAPGLALLAARRGHPFRTGYLAGFVHYLISVSWLLEIPVRFYPILGWIGLAAYLAVYPATWAWLCTRLLRGSKTAPQMPAQREAWLTRAAMALFAAVAWVALEMAIARMLSGFPWNLLGASQYQMLPMIQVAEWTSVYGVSFLIVWFSVSLAAALERLASEPRAANVLVKEMACPVLAVALVYAFGLKTIASRRDESRTIRAALVQPSIPQTMIWNPAEADKRFAELLRLSAAALTNKPDLLIWPEAAVPKMIRDDPATLRAITGLGRSNAVWIIIGSDDFEFRGTNVIYFNSSFLISPRGELVSAYRKRRLVAFGEYVPLADWIPFIKYFTPIEGGFTAGNRPVVFDLSTLNVKTSVLICFEDVFAHYAREHATQEVDFLVNITNDGWFGKSAAQWQHAASAVFRAVENRKPLVRCANNGLSCWIDAVGGMHNVEFPEGGDIYHAGFKLAEVRLARETGAATFYQQHGDWFGWSCVLVTLAISAPMLARVRRRKNGAPD